MVPCHRMRLRGIGWRRAHHLNPSMGCPRRRLRADARQPPGTIGRAGHRVAVLRGRPRPHALRAAGPRSAAANFKDLEVAWRFKTDNLGPRPEFTFQSTPLMVNGVLYSTAGTRRAVIALNAGTGELEVDARPGRRAARRGGTATVLGTRAVVLERRQTGADLLRHAGLSLARPRREDWRTRPRLRPRRSGRFDARLRSGRRPARRRRRAPLDPARDPRRDHRRRRAPDRRESEKQDEREGLRARLRRAHGQAPVDVPHDPAAERGRRRHVAERIERLHRQHRRLGADLGR